MLEFFSQSNVDVDQAMVLAKKWQADDLRETYKGINEDGACAINQSTETCGPHLRSHEPSMSRWQYSGCR